MITTFVLKRPIMYYHGIRFFVIAILMLSPATFVHAQTDEATMALPVKGQVVPLEQIKGITQHFGLETLWAKIEKDPPGLPFKSDGCSGWFEEWNGVSLYHACFLHDLKYWAGHPDEDVARLEADAELMMDIARALDSTFMAETMFRGVRAGGIEELNLSFSWGFGRR